MAIQKTHLAITDLQTFAELAYKAAIRAGEEILRIYETDFSVTRKEDYSPLTEADTASHRIIASQLGDDFPLLSEEGIHLPFETRISWEYFWLVDPLDGTKEFIKRNGEFTVNIALMHRDTPVLGIITQPVKRIAWTGIPGTGFSKTIYQDESTPMNPLRNVSPEKHDGVVRIIASRSHMSPETAGFISAYEKKGKVEIISSGSSLKFCLLADGEADVYPRFAPTMEWDTAAGHAICKAAGRNVYVQPSGDEMRYNKRDLRNPWFVAK